MLKPVALRCTLFLALGVPILAGAAEMYRYVDEHGLTVVNRLGVPPESVAKGYEVLNEKGRVVRVVPPAPDAEERKRLAEEKAKAKSDAQLLRIYSEVADVDRARDRKLAELDGVIGVAQGNLQSLRTQQDNLQAKAAEHERAGRAVPEHLLVQIENLKIEQAGVEKDIQRYREGRDAEEAAFAADRARLLELRQR